MKALVIRSAIVAALGGLIFGFDTAVISGAEEQIQQVFGLSDAKLGFTVTTALIGTIVGALVAGRPADRYGRKKVALRDRRPLCAGRLGLRPGPRTWRS